MKTTLGQELDPVRPTFGRAGEVLPNAIGQQLSGCIGKVEITADECRIGIAFCSLDIGI